MLNPEIMNEHLEYENKKLIEEKCFTKDTKLYIILQIVH